jgi:hypothetical protein
LAVQFRELAAGSTAKEVVALTGAFATVLLIGLPEAVTSAWENNKVRARAPAAMDVVFIRDLFLS